MVDRLPKFRVVKDNKLLCSKCLTWKCFEDFPVSKSASTGRYSSCRICTNAYKRNSYNSNTTLKQSIAKSSRKWHLEKKYNISQEDYENLLKIQNNRCAICENLFSDTKGHRPHIDHCHSTNKVRGLLCPNCNIGLGNFYDDINSLSNAIIYLKENT